MKKSILILTFSLFVSMSFVFPQKELILKYGTYGYCKNCGSLNAKIELKINKDNTFSYFDNSDSKKIVDINGTWVRANNTIFLKEYKSSFKIHNKWRIQENGFCLKSRNNLEFSRLCFQ